ncbi:LysE/ArgO family amino acid transporter [Anaerosinus sp.]|uniref:LysE/ArgO family amino acid transporter n=1 Tax=Selenobaculum sp. TaxID=3074374 RepID=UPI0015A816FF
MIAFVHGFCLALGLILPLGVQNLFVFQQGIVQRKLLYAIPVAVTAAICDTILIILSVSGVSMVFIHFCVLKNCLLVCGILFLLYMGYINWRNCGDLQGVNVKAFLPKQQIVFAMSVSFLNPYAFLDIIGVIGTSSLQYENEEKMLFTFACILVSWIWFFSLAFAGRCLGAADNLGNKIKIINKISSLFIWGTALMLIYNLILNSKLL